MTKTCISGKKGYATVTLAEDALIEARTRFDFAANHGPVAVYLCEDCGAYHLTSRGPVNPRLAALLSDGSIQKQKEADRWLDKLRHKRW